MDLADESDSDAFNPDNYESSDEEEEAPAKQKKGKSKGKKGEDSEDSYDIGNMDYEGDPDELPDFDLIDENDKYNYRDENQLSDDESDFEENMDEEDEDD